MLEDLKNNEKLILKIHITTQTIYDCFYMSKLEFMNIYKQILPDFTDIDLNVMWSGIRENFEHRSSYLNKSSKLDQVKFARYKQTLLGEENKVNDEEQDLIDNGDPLSEAKNILLNDVSYKWTADKIRAMSKAGYNLDQIKKVFQGTNITESYIAKYIGK